MPRGPKGEKRPADVIGNAVHVMRIATGEVEDETKSQAAVSRGRLGGKARSTGMTAKKRKEIAKKAARARWKAAPVPAEEENRRNARAALPSGATAPPFAPALASARFLANRTTPMSARPMPSVRTSLCGCQCVGSRA